ELKILAAVENVNTSQKTVLVHKLRRHLGMDLKNQVVAVWGLAFKPNTDDVREAPSLYIIKELLDAGVKLQLFDPIAMDQVKKVYPESSNVKYSTRAEDALENAEALLIVTEWKDFRSPDFNQIKATLKRPIIID